MPKFRLRTQVIDALQFNGQNFEEVMRFAEKAASRNNTDRNLVQITQANTETLLCYPGEWIVKQADSRYIVVPDAIFFAQYEEVRAEPKTYDVAWFEQRCRSAGVKIKELNGALELRCGNNLIIYYLRTGCAGLKGDRPVPTTPEAAIRWVTRF